MALRNINLIVQKKPDILKHEMKVFFVKYNDPIYVKLEKLDIMIRLASQANIAQVLSELKEYATEVSEMSVYSLFLDLLCPWKFPSLIKRQRILKCQTFFGY